MKDLSAALGARLETKWAAVMAGAAGEGGAGAGVVLLGHISPSSQHICHPYAQDHNPISSIRPGKEAFKLLILCWGAMTALPRISSVGPI